MPRHQQALKPYLEKIAALEFIDRHELSQDQQDGGIDVLNLWTSKGKFTFLVEQKSSYFDRSSLNAFISQAKHYAQAYRKPLLLLTRYMPAPSAERLIAARINFVDQTGNMHLALGNSYVRTVMGNKERPSIKESVVATPAKVQLLFTFAVYPEAGNWTVRQLADASGLSKSNVAKIKQQLLEQGVLRTIDNRVQIANPQKIEDELLRGYGSVLRPRLLINRFRARESRPEQLIKRIEDVAHNLSVNWSLTGGPAAYELQHFYQGPEVPVFIDSFSEQFLRAMRIIPDANGPLVLLRSMGRIPYWKEIGRKTLAHPRLIYSELMYSSDPRAHEAAQEIKREFLGNA